MSALSHDALAHSLAAHLAGYSVPMVVWTDMQMGPAGSARPDVYAIEKTYTAVRARVFEIKISRADFLSDVTSGKYLKYNEFAGSITFATPAGLVSKAEVPKGCGLITRSEDGQWRYQKKPTLQATPPLSQSVWLKLVIDGIGRERATIIAGKCEPRYTNAWKQQDIARRLAGEEIGRAMANRDRALAALNDEAAYHELALKQRREAQESAVKKEREEFDAMVAAARSALGLSAEAAGRGIWDIRQELDARIKGAAENRVRDAIRTVDHALAGLKQERDNLARLLPEGRP
ncbi:MAG: hypothetical protein KA763_00495 [Xanthomonadales bacterium]|nr:hypothetical protein [Xanthomonadales bacterium]